jgi:CheY-like chemotaxis protein
VSAGIVKPIVLVVDDDVSIRQLFSRALSSIATVEEASNGAEALHLLSIKRYDCLLLDLHMPGIDGHGVLKALADKKGPNSNTPRIVATADMSAQARAGAFGGAAMSFVPKPVSIAMLVMLVQSALKKSASQRATEAAFGQKKS